METYNDNKYIKFCHSLAKNGIPDTFLNPTVGACLVYNDQVIGWGYHQKYGEAHAEVSAIESVKPELRYLIREATLYISLEPCNHQGKTAACTELILKNGIKTVVFGCFDPNPLMQGRSIHFLKENEIEVRGPILEEESKTCIQPFMVRSKFNRPYITLKWAQSKDYFLGKSGQKIKISEHLSDMLVHKLRSQHDGIMIGARTFINDHPKLNVRLWHGTDPTVILMDRSKLIEESSNDLDKLYENWILLDNPEKKLNEQLRLLLKDEDMSSILVEGGADLLEGFIDTNHWDQAVVITNQALQISTGIKAPCLRGTLTKQMQYGNDIIHIIKNEYAC